MDLEQRQKELCFGTLQLYSRKESLERELANVNAQISANITAITEVEKIMTEQKAAEQAEQGGKTDET